MRTSKRFADGFNRFGTWAIQVYIREMVRFDNTRRLVNGFSLEDINGISDDFTTMHQWFGE